MTSAPAVPEPWSWRSARPAPREPHCPIVAMPAQENPLSATLLAAAPPQGKGQGLTAKRGGEPGMGRALGDPRTPPMPPPHPLLLGQRLWAGFVVTALLIRAQVPCTGRVSARPELCHGIPLISRAKAERPAECAHKDGGTMVKRGAGPQVRLPVFLPSSATG